MALTVTWSLACGPPLRAQVDATIDLGLGAVKYEGFLGSAAASLTPTLRYDGRAVSAAAQGSFLLYESGRHLIQGAGALAYLSPPVGPLRGELSAFGGLSSYDIEPVGGYGVARGRVHAVRGSNGLWLGGGLGRSYAGISDVGTSELAVGAWSLIAGSVISAAVTRTRVRDTVYTDLAATVRWTASVIEIDALLGARVWSSLDDEGAFGDVAVRLWLTTRIAAQITTGTYRSDPLRSGVAGYYVSAGVRIAPFSRRSPARTLDERLRSRLRLPAPPPGVPSAPALTVERTGAGGHALTIYAPGAARVEVAADFTDWQPVALHRGHDDRWRLDLALGPGLYRINVRVDGGGWIVPRGVAVQKDEFGSRVGLVVVR